MLYMKLKQALKGLSVLELKGDPETEISSVVTNSQQVRPGALFIALQGSLLDGHMYVSDAVARGATTVVIEKPVKVEEGINTILVENTNKAQAIIGRNFYDNPASKLKIIGITGTKGKTTTTFLIRSILEQAGYKTGLIGTIYNIIDDKRLPTRNTTPASLELQSLLSKMVEVGTDYVVMEVSSHAIALERIEGLSFFRGIFTNITRDHLDFHQTFEEYFKVKSQFFTALPKEAKAIINIDDPRAKEIIKLTDAKVLSYGLVPEAEIRAEQVKSTMKNTEFDLITPWGNTHLRLNLIGKFNVYNALAAIGTGFSLGIDPKKIYEGLEKLQGVPGRFELVPGSKEYTVVVDYAHTPDSLKNILYTARALVKNRVITVFGCGGNRDRGKRPIMGKIVADLSDYAIITNDNPRREDPKIIAEQIKAGFTQQDNPKNYEIILDREAAIRKAISIAKKGDMVIIAGKGHEAYQDFGDYVIHFDDKQIAELAIKEKENA